MSRVYLLRHARAAWPQPGMRDFDRPLEADAAAEAEALGLAMQVNGQRPDKVICSTAKRTRDTWAQVAAGLKMDAQSAEFSDALYCGDSAGYMDMIRANSGVGSLMLVGHNPMLEDVAFGLSKNNGSAACLALEGGFDACGLAVIDFEGPLSAAGPAKGCLRIFLTPEDL